MKTIYKYPLHICDAPVVEMPEGAIVRHVAPDDPGGDPLRLWLWAEVDDCAPAVLHRFVLRGTGQPIPEVGDFVATVIDRQFVWHIWKAI